MIIKRLIVLFAMAGMALPAGAGAESGSPSKMVVEAKKYLAEGDLRAAEIQLKNALRSNAHDLEARVMLGLVALRQGDGAGAERSFQIAKLQGAASAEIDADLGRAYLLQGKAKEILAELKPDGLEAGGAAQIDNLRARADLILKRPKEAAQEANAALSAQPEMAEALLTLAVLSRQQGDNKAAAALIDRALASAPGNQPALDAKGDLLAATGDARGALEAFAKASLARPDDDMAQLGQASALLALNKSDAAQIKIDLVLHRRPNQPAALYLQALILEAKGRYAEADAVLEPASGALVDSLAPQILLGELNLRANKIGKAEGYAQHALSLAPTSVSAKLLLALVYDRENQPLKIAQLLEPLAIERPENGQVQMLLGDAYCRLGRYEEGVKALAAAYRQNPTDSNLRTRLDAGRINKGDVEAGMTDLSAMLQTDPKSLPAGRVLIAATIARGRLSDALNLAVKQRELHPDNEGLAVLIGRIHWMLGDWAAAEQDFRAALSTQPDDMEAIRALIVMRQVRNEPDQAASLYHAALERDPKGIAAMIALSRLAQSQGDEGGAMSWLEKAVAVRPESLDVQMQVIALLATQNKAQKALASSEALARSAPDSPAVIAQLAQLQFAGGLREEGILSLRHLASLAAVNGQIELGQQLASFDLPAEALKSYRHATEIAPDNVNAWRSLVIAEARLTGLPSSLETVKRAFLHAAVAPYGNELKGEAYCAAGRTDDAESAFRAALKSKPESWLLLRLASCSVHSGDRTGEIAILADWLKAHPKDNIVRVAYASALMETQHNDAAIKEFQILLAADPVNVAVLNDLAWLQSGDGTANALHNAALAFGLAPQSPQVCDTLAWVLLQKGDLASAASLLRASHDVWPADPDITYHLAVALARHGDIGGARLLVKPLADSKIAFASRDDAKLLAQSLSSAQE